jgi:uncharacterized protein (TIGR02687 family)
VEILQIKENLAKCFIENSCRIVFWNDPNGEFLSIVDEIAGENVTVVKVNEHSLLEIKILLEINDTEGQYLIYESSEEPNLEDDWLLNLRFCSESFRADKSSLILAELGLAQQGLRSYIERRRKFFDSKDRFNKLKLLISSSDAEADIERHMIAILTKSDSSDLYSILLNLFAETFSDGVVDLDCAFQKWSQIEKFNLEESFWQMIQNKFGYSDDSPNLKKLMHRLFVADYISQSRAEVPAQLKIFALPNSGQANAVVCLAQWRNSRDFSKFYDAIATYVSEDLSINFHINNLSLEQLINMNTFEAIEDAVERNLLKLLVTNALTLNASEIKALASKRQASHWVKSNSNISEGKKRYSTYECVVKAAEFIDLKNKYVDGFKFKSAQDMYRLYESELYRFDQLYRQFCENAEKVNSSISDSLKPLQALIESTYCNWYLQNLSVSWGAYVGGGLLETWKIDELPNQYDFYNRFVDVYIDKADKRRAFVIISDALRYEVAQEISEHFKGEYRFDATLASQLGVLPSYTSLGMAALLPHSKIEYSSDGAVLVNGKPTSSLENRNEILKPYNGMAISSDELLKLKKEEGRKLIEGTKVVYIYHNMIDARGDKQATENETFAACRDAIDDLKTVIRYTIDNLNGTHVVLTADHGFHFTESAPTETDKSRLQRIPGGQFKYKKRYLLGRGLPDYLDAWHGKTSVTAKTSDNVEFWIPKGTSRFHFTGGAKFVHGGSMPQEIVVPVLTVKQIKTDEKREKTQTRDVGVQVLGVRHKITSQRYRFNLIQTEPVSDRVKAVTIKVGVYSGMELISSLETIRFDSASDKMDERQKEVILTLKDQQFDRNETYHFIIRDADTLKEIQRVDVSIDRIITDDF